MRPRYDAPESLGLEGNDRLGSHALNLPLPSSAPATRSTKQLQPEPPTGANTARASAPRARYGHPSVRGRPPPMVRRGSFNQGSFNRRASRDSSRTSEEQMDETPSFDKFYEERAAAFYDKAVMSLAQAPAPAAVAPAAPAFIKPGSLLLRRAIQAVKGETKRPMWEHVFSKEARLQQGYQRRRLDDKQGDAWQEMQKRFEQVTRQVSTVQAAKSVFVPPVTSDEAICQDAAKRRAALRARAETLRIRKKEEAVQQASREELSSLFPLVWNEAQSPAWGERTSPAWGGLGWNYEQSEDGASLAHGWDEGVVSAASSFDERHAKFSGDMQRLLSPRQGTLAMYEPLATERKLAICLFKLHSSRFSVQPLRLDSNMISPANGSSVFEAQEMYKKQIALTGGSRGGPFCPVYTRTLEGFVEEVAPPPPRKEPWTLFASIWGPRCDWCDGQDFFDHEEVLFERFATDWQIILRLGVYKMVTEGDDDGKADGDGDGVADELEDVGAVMFFNAALYSLAWLWYSDVIFSGGSDLSTGVKKELGWKSFADDVGVWEQMSEADKAGKNTLIFMAVDKTDKMSAASIKIQASARGKLARNGRETRTHSSQKDLGLVAIGREADEVKINDTQDKLLERTKFAADQAADKSQAITAKMDNQLSRPEFAAALIKTAIERFIKSKQNPDNELTDVSDAVDRVFREYIDPALAEPLSTKTQAKLPLPDALRETACYTEAMTDVLDRHAPSLRVLFAALARVSYERSRSNPPVLPKVGKNKQVKRDRARWTVVPGLMSYSMWNLIVSRGLQPKGMMPKQRDISLCFVYSVMCVIDNTSDEGKAKERNLPFEGFLEALIRLATVAVIPTDKHLADAEIAHAGTFMEQINEETLGRLYYEQRCEWGSTPPAATSGEMPRRVELLLDMLLRNINPPREADEPVDLLTRRGARRWLLTNGVTEHELPDSWANEKGVGETADC